MYSRMDIKQFPFRIDDRTHVFLSGLVTASNQSGGKIQSLVNGTCSILFEKRNGLGLDGNIAFTPEAVKIQYTISSITKQNKEVAGWLNRYHAFLQKSKNDALVPIVNRCFVEIHAFYDGRLEYYLTYMVAHSDESIAQDTAQGSLYHRGGLSIGYKQPSHDVAVDVEIETASHW